VTRPTERQFVVFARGQLREDMLRYFRIGLRGKIDPGTGQTITEDTIRRITAPGSRFYREADAIDLEGMAIQRRAEYTANQFRLDRASSRALRDLHGNLWEETPLPGTGGSGLVTAAATPGTTFLGSTTVPDPLAHVATDQAGNRFQVLVGGQADAQGVATLTLKCIDTGESTNIDAGTELTWSNPPAGAQPKATAAAQFTGGTGAETDAEFSDRVHARVKKKPGIGNPAQVRAFARQASNAVEEAFVYPCTFGSGSFLVAITQKRANVPGPLARIAGLTALTAVTGYLVPPGSPVIPPRVRVVVTTVSPEPSDLAVRLALPTSSLAGWADREPWPGFVTSSAVVTTVTDQQNFRVSADTGLPGNVASLSGGSQPSLMVWDEAAGAWKQLKVGSVTRVGGAGGAGDFDVVLANGPQPPIAVNDIISPDMARRNVVAQAAQDYFDSLGPGEILDLGATSRGGQAFRRPEPGDEWRSRAGHPIVSWIGDGLGSALAGAYLASISLETPSIPADPIDGPNMLTLGKLGVYHLT